MSIAEKLTTVAENVPKVYDSGKTAGIAIGKQAEYDTFWDSYQSAAKNQYRTYPAQFAGMGWDTNTFKPKYDIKPTNAYLLFYNNYVFGDLVEILNGLGVSLDTSRITSAQYMFWLARFSRIGEIDLRSAQANIGATTQTFSTANLITIDKLIVKDSNIFASNMFSGASSLANITIEGVVGDSISFKDSPLTKASITSIINALSSTATGKTATFKKTAKEAAFTDDEWAALIAQKTNWTISLV